MKWKIRVIIPKAEDELSFLFKDEDIRDEIKRILALLATEADPRTPHIASNLIVDEIQFDSPHWFQVKVARYGICIVFRLLLVDGDPPNLVELDSQQPIPSEIPEKYIDIVQVAFRKDAYEEELRKRYLTYRLSPDD